MIYKVILIIVRAENVRQIYTKGIGFFSHLKCTVAFNHSRLVTRYTRVYNCSHGLIAKRVKLSYYHVPYVQRDLMNVSQSLNV